MRILLVLLALLPLPALAAPPTVELIDAGNGPKQALRFAPLAGSKQHMDMTMKIGMTMSVGGQTMPQVGMPAMKLGMDIDVKDTTAGRISYDFAFTTIDVASDATSDPAVVAQLQAMLAPVAGIKGSAVVDDRGFFQSGGIGSGENTAPELADMLNNLNRALDQLVAPLPAEPVGIGARWRVNTHLDSNGIKLDQSTVYTLQRRDGAAVTLDVETTQSAQPQSVKINDQPGGTFQLSSLAGSAKGSTTLRLDRVVPAEGKVVGHTDTVMVLDMLGTPQTMSMGMDVDTTIAGQ